MTENAGSTKPGVPYKMKYTESFKSMFKRGWASCC